MRSARPPRSDPSGVGSPGEKFARTKIMPGAPILVVDDSRVNLKLMRLLLTFEGFDVRTSERAEEALEMLDSFRPALVLTDIQMPGMDGLEMTRRIKGDRRTSGIKVAALTASTSKLDNQRAIEAGCEDYISKPVNTSILAARLRGLLGEKPVARSATALAAPKPNSPAPDVGTLRLRFLREGANLSRDFLESLDGRLDSMQRDRKSTRLNSSHLGISYAVF